MIGGWSFVLEQPVVRGYDTSPLFRGRLPGEDKAPSVGGGCRFEGAGVDEKGTRSN